MKRLLITTALATLIASSPALAQSQTDDTKAPGAAQEQQMNEKPAGESTAATPTGGIEFVSSQKETDWLASSLMGRAVQNAEGTTLGDINNVLLDQNGDVIAVLIGVGGFLGIGGKDVAVNYGALEFKKREVRQPVTGEDARESAYKRTASPQAGGGSPLLETQSQQKAAQAVQRKDADHSDMVIVLNASAEQLESAPAFRRIGQAEPQEQGETSPAEKEDKMKPDQQRQ